MDGHQRRYFWQMLRDTASDPYIALIAITAGVLWLFEKITGKPEKKT